ncbi:unnamed protein product [Penicillium salamii]|uniref:Uncharacterized protein n=1 Tax=Penicillium salamii TaxID=1612424 RepID=A0A9W4NIS9_9EURO|nr:unnamed protein product [Penicillium salamii]CAG8170737.1 unnamed protein product [Penicillium salamii]CAG8225717.1 unnamed protein product [Penicillium salamii]CAG8319747.1 unnamed protein product [Penicillium salamii]CAG8371768.1 unnamed protein product [Penicillium salamii]
MATLRESEKDLRDLLKSGISPSEESFNEVTLLQLAMGWPTGVKLLRQTHPRTFLPHSYHSGHLSYLSITDEDDQINRYIQSCRNLIEDGFTIQIGAIVDGSSNKVTRLLIHELAKRRRNLLDIAEAHIHYSVLSDLRNGETGIPDASAPAICDALTAKGHKIDQTLTAFQRRSIFCWKQHPDNLNTIYEAGFTDVDLPSTEGFTALMFQCMPYFDDHSCMTVAWMISKGADPFRKLPGLETTVLHWINAGLGQRFQIEANEIQRGNRAASYFDPYAAICHLHQIDRHLFSLSIKDACLCSCSLDGCSPLSVALRDTVHHLYLGDQQISQDAHRFRQFLEFLLHHNQSKIEVCHTLIRSLTFDGLGLSHTCCTELRHYEPWDCIRHESDLQEIREEQKLSLGRFENLVSEFVSQFDALGLSLMDFLQNAWYERMVRFISERDKYDHEHHEKIRELGINCWETDEIEIPLVVQLICDQARVVESDSEDS